ncbi:uncharacterized protein PAN0_002d1305 [Moesziomyces antarcticus]|uniref:Uncharacterized protein n=1 Tax=Pseudozyma antarctica TaxID=84753 RepID=A0A5C3FG94_PSEA2|nr:uncharacterized protein PAN0_002d1305 [Moesziomyces antarcticus]GAK63103.1 conserved hypothetical protein [Moesziomyces antarcticus]SPO43413.1 uncharacterized protein PSANT_01098 [Moesziomyces antarcticus]
MPSEDPSSSPPSPSAVQPVLDPDQAAAIGVPPASASAAMQPSDPEKPQATDPDSLKLEQDVQEQAAGRLADQDSVPAPAAALDHEAHLHHVPKAEVAPERVTELPGTQDEVPAPAPGDPDRPIEPELEDLGWSEQPNVPIPVLNGMKNESLWLLVRRFNKQTYRVKAIEGNAKRDFDMYISNEEQFQPDKLKATFERFYVNVVVGTVAFIQHIARLRSWSEPKRTGGFMVVYVAAWLLDVIVPTMLAFMIVLILSPRARLFMFPSAPLAAIDPKTGQAKVPKAGHLGSKTSLTGAAETYEGEAVEQEASNFVGALGSVALSTAAGKSSNDGVVAAQDEEDTDSDEDSVTGKSNAAGRKGTSSAPKKDPEDKIPDPTNVAAVTQAAQSKAAGEKAGQPEKGDHTKKPMEEAIFASLAPFMHILNNICDDYERFCNALSPTPPFSRWMPRCRLAGAILPVLLASLYVNETMIYKGSTFGFGFALFGQPLIDRVKFPQVIAWLDRNVPDWKKYLELRFMLLRGVPTNAQLTVTLLRIGEANKSPLPPPPPTAVAPPPSALHGSDMADHPDLPPEYAEQLAEAQADDVASRPEGEHESATDPKAGKKGSSKVLAVLKGVTKAGVETALGVNRVKATTIQSMHAKAKLGVVRSEEAAQKYAADGPVKFHCRYRGKRGYAYVLTTAATPSIAFERKGKTSPLSAAVAANKGASSTASAAETAQRLVQQRGASFAIAIDEIAEIHKVGGLGWKGKLVVGWALGGEVADGIEILDKQGNIHKLTAMGRRDEVFNRLIALGSQKWEAF